MASPHEAGSHPLSAARHNISGWTRNSSVFPGSASRPVHTRLLLWLGAQLTASLKIRTTTQHSGCLMKMH